ncbi:small VCP/p97-interacting protein isoform X3 [Parus major]|uniref:small VCP/p97-interacting protein isoform X3 n=1 Tax=Parus major TaxID=9157 RepID=UPI001443B9A9|nr:small VCP/p97-interacting protein isoform X3 [Parus major]
MRVSAGGGDLPSSTWRPGREAVVVPREVVAVPGKGNTSFGPRPGVGRTFGLKPPGASRSLGPGAQNVLLLCLTDHVWALLWLYGDRGFQEIKRRQLAEAAEKRQMEASSRGIKNAYSVEQKKKKQEEIERRIAASCPGGEGRLRWQVG